MRCPRAALGFTLLAAGLSEVTVPSTSDALRYIGRFDHQPQGSRFDRNGCEVQFDVEGASQVTVQISQRLTAPYSSPWSPVGSQPHHFLVYVDDQPLTTPIPGSACGYCTFDTNNIANDTVTEYVVATGLSFGTHHVRIMKTSEPEWNTREPSPNWVTLHGVSVDTGSIEAPSVPRRKLRLEFIGDSITAGFCNLCDGPGRIITNESVWQQDFDLAWPNQICETLEAECSTIGWSGMGLIRNCCGGETFMPDVWNRTVATDGSLAWNFSSWVPDALVVNLGTNDWTDGATPAFVTAYEELVQLASSVYGPGLNVFLACGPMSEIYCDSVFQTLGNATAQGIQAHFLDQRNFLNGTYGPKCCGHPSVEVDGALAAAGAKFISDTLGSNRDTSMLV
jgi:hypothetical protein